MTFWKTPDFKALQELWYEKLADEGFRDEERLNCGDPILKHIGYRVRDTLTRETRECYFRMISELVSSSEFSREVDKLILTWYADGRKIKSICQDLEARGERRNRQSVRFIIRRYEMRWGIKIYSRKELNLK